MVDDEYAVQSAHSFLFVFQIKSAGIHVRCLSISTSMDLIHFEADTGMEVAKWTIFFFQIIRRN